MKLKPIEGIELGSWLGRSQVFGLVANQSMAAQVDCIRRVRENGLYKSAGLTWEEFCQQHLGMSRTRIESLLSNFEEFGATYFRLSEIVRISAESYRQIAPKVTGEKIEIDGEMVDLVPENAPRIRRSVQRMVEQLRKSRQREEVLGTEIAGGIWLARVRKRFDDCLDDLYSLSKALIPEQEANLVRKLLAEWNASLKGIAKELEATSRYIDEQQIERPTLPAVLNKG